MISERRAGAVLSYVYIIVNSLIILIYQPYLIRTLGSSEYGLYELAASVINYMTVLDLGFGNGIVVYTAKYHAAGRFDEEKKLHGMFSMIFCGIGIVAAAIGLIFSFNVGSIFSRSLTAAELGKAKILMLILTANMGLTFPLSIYGNIIIANEKFVFTKVITILRALLNPLMMLPLLLFGADSIALVTVLSVINIFCLLLNYFYCTKKLGIKVKFCGFDKVIFLEILAYSVFIFIAEIVDKVNWYVDKFLLGMFSGTAEVTLYSAASLYHQMVLQISAVLSSVMLPKISKMVARNEGDTALNREFIKTSRLQYYLVFLVTCGFALYGRNFVDWHLDGKYGKAYFVALILIVSSLIPITQSVAISIIKAKNRFKFRAFVLLAMAVANIGISIPLTIRFKSIGSAAGTAAALIIANIIIINIYYQKKCGIDIVRYWKEIGKMTLLFLPAIAVSASLKIFIPIDGIFELLIYGSLFVVLYSLTAYFAIMDEYEKGIVKKYLGKVTKVIRKR